MSFKPSNNFKLFASEPPTKAFVNKTSYFDIVLESDPPTSKTTPPVIEQRDVYNNFPVSSIYMENYIIGILASAKA